MLTFAASLISGLECLLTSLLAGLLVLGAILSGICAPIGGGQLHVHLDLIDHQPLCPQSLQNVALVIGELAIGRRIVDRQLDTELFT